MYDFNFKSQGFMDNLMIYLQMQKDFTASRLYHASKNIFDVWKLSQILMVRLVQRYMNHTITLLLMFIKGSQLWKV